MSNPYSSGSKVMRNAPHVPATSRDGVRGGARTAAGRMFPSANPAYGANGELNAASIAGLIQAIGHLAPTAQAETRTAAAKQAEVAERNASARIAYNDSGTAKLQVLGEVLVNDIWETLGRQGFSRTLLGIQNVAQGEVARIKVRKKDVMAFMATDDSNIQEVKVHQDYIYPAEVIIASMITIDDKEIAQASGDILEEKFQDGLEATMVREDRLCRAAMIAASGTFNDPVIFTNFNPSVLTVLRTQVQRHGNPASNLVISFDLWDDIIADTDFVQWFDPVHKHELYMEGRLGRLMGMDIITDGFRYDTLKVLEAGEAFVTGAPTTLGVLSQRKELDSRAIDLYPFGRSARGWYMQEIISLTVGNGRSVSRGSRV